MCSSATLWRIGVQLGGLTSILAGSWARNCVQCRWLQAMLEGKDELVTRRFDQFVTQYVHIGDLGLIEWFTGLINTSMASVRMMKYCFGRKYLGDSSV